MNTVAKPSARRTDVLTLGGGILFSFFTGVIWLAGQRLQAVPH